MKPIDQTKKGHNCFRVCLASLLEVGIEDIPDFGASKFGETGQGMIKNWVEMGKWLKEEHAYTLIDFYIEHGRDSKELCRLPAMYHITCGPSSINDGVMHAVVSFQGEMVHDPHPERRGITRAIGHTFLIPVSSFADFRKLFSQV